MTEQVSRRRHQLAPGTDGSGQDARSFGNDDGSSALWAGRLRPTGCSPSPTPSSPSRSRCSPLTSRYRRASRRRPHPSASPGPDGVRRLCAELRDPRAGLARPPPHLRGHRPRGLRGAAPPRSRCRMRSAPASAGSCWACWWACSPQVRDPGVGGHHPVAAGRGPTHQLAIMAADRNLDTKCPSWGRRPAACTTRLGISRARCRGGVGVGGRGGPHGAPGPAVNSLADRSSHSSRIRCGASSSCLPARAGPW